MSYHGNNIEIINKLHHRLHLGKVIFTLKHRCFAWVLLSDWDTDHDHFLTCVNTHQQKSQRVASIEKSLEKIHHPSSRSYSKPY